MSYRPPSRASDWKGILATVLLVGGALVAAGTWKGTIESKLDRVIADVALLRSEVASRPAAVAPRVESQGVSERTQRRVSREVPPVSFGGVSVR